MEPYSAAHPSNDALRHWEGLYRDTKGPLPWEIDQLPEDIGKWAALVGPGSSVIDLGCGRGGHALALEKLGHVVTGIDFSASAIEEARRRAGQAGSKNASFEVADILTYRTSRDFGLAFDYSVLHHISDDRIGAYALAVERLLGGGGVFGVVCYAEALEDCGRSVARVGALGNVIFHRSYEQVCAIFSVGFRLVQYGSSRLGPRKQHAAHSFTFRKHE